MKKLYEYNIQLVASGKTIRVQQSAFSYEDAQRRIMEKYPSARNFKMLKKAGYPHKIG